MRAAAFRLPSWLLIVVALPTATAAQSPAPPQISDSARIRIWAPDLDLKEQEGRFVSWGDSALLGSGLVGPAPVEVAFGAMTRLDVHSGESHALGFLRGAGVGAGVLGTLGLIAGLASVAGCDDFLCELDSLRYAAIGGGIGLGVGGLIGLGVPVQRWTRQELPREVGFGEPQKDWGNTWLLVGGGVLLAGLLAQ